MPIPGVSVTIRDPGLARGVPANLVSLIYGVSSAGEANKVKLFASPASIVDEYGDGPLVEAALRTLKQGGRPVALVRSDASVSASLSAVATAGSGPTVTVTGTPIRRVDAVVRIKTAGAIGTSTFDYSLDGGITYSSERDTVASFVIPGTGVTVEFAAGSYVAGETYTFTGDPAFYNATDISALQTALLATGRRFNFIHFAGSAPASDMVTLFAAVASMMTALFNQFRYKRAIMAADDPTDTDDTTILDAWSSAVSLRISRCHSWAFVPSERPIEGGGFWRAPTAHLMAARQASLLVSTDQSRTDSPITDVHITEDGSPNMGHDEYVNEAGYDDAQISTLRTWPDRPGVFVTNLHLSSGPSSNFRYFQDGLVADRACEIAVSRQIDWIGRQLRTNPDNVPNDGDTGTLFEVDANNVESYINDALAGSLLRPQNADGFSGHVTDIRYALDRSYDVGFNEGFQGSVGIVKLTPAKNLRVSIGFVRSIA